jgi:hypothetical protein
MELYPEQILCSLVVVTWKKEISIRRNELLCFGILFHHHISIRWGFRLNCNKKSEYPWFGSLPPLSPSLVHPPAAANFRTRLGGRATADVISSALLRRLDLAALLGTGLQRRLVAEKRSGGGAATRRIVMFVKHG